MIQHLRNWFMEGSVAVCGSGPSAWELDPGDWDAVIALNKAIELPQLEVLKRKPRLGCSWPLYWMMFDGGIVQRREPWLISNLRTIPLVLVIGFEFHRELARASLAPVSPDWLIEFDYQAKSGPEQNPARMVPVFDRGMTELTNNGNVAICGVETAIIMGAARIGLYGIDLAQRKHFDGVRGEGAYHPGVAEYMNGLLRLCVENGMEVKVCGSPECQIEV